MAVEGFTGARQPVDAKVGELNPSSRAVNVLAKVVSKSEVRNVAAGKDGEPHKVSDALVGDETGSIYLTLWDDNIEKVHDGDTILIKNGYINLFRGNMRLNVGRYGTLEISEKPLAGEVNSEKNMSTQVYEQPRRSFGGGGRRDFGGGRRDFGGRDGDRRGGYRPRRY